mgnify:FL=1
MTSTILIVDDEDDIRHLIAGLLSDEGYKSIEARDKPEALRIFEEKKPDAVLLDIWLEGGTREGLEILAAIKEQGSPTPVIMMSGHGTLETAVEAIKTGAYDFLEKPFKTDRLLIMLRRAIEQASLQQRLMALESGRPSEALVAHSRAMQDLLAEIDKVGPTKSRVLLTAEAGSGKSVIGRLIHERSGRKGKCVIVNGGSFDPAQLVEAEGGTLILEQPEDLSPAAQADLTRVLQDPADIRFVTTTRADLKSLVQSGQFREDLFYRLNVVPLSLPPLRDRKADIPDLVNSLMPALAQQLGRPSPKVSDEEMSWLQSQDWPGNVRELKNTLERFLILNHPLSKSHEERNTEAGGGWSALLSLPLKDAREHFERDYLQAQLLRHDKNITATADFVGMDRAALHRKLKGLGIE